MANRTSKQGVVRAAEAIQLRRAELRLTQPELARRAGLSLRTVQAVEAGSVAKPVTRADLEHALGWELGTLSRMYAGQQDSPRQDHNQIHNGPEADDGSTVELYSPALADLLDHPGLSSDMRNAIRARLNQIHDEFAQEAARLFGLADPPAEPDE